MAIERLYYPLYWQKGMTLLPRWGGSHEKFKAFAARAADLTKNLEGQSLYVRVAATGVVMYYREGPEEFLKFNFPYERLKQGHEDILRLYPKANHYLNTYCFIASLYGDKKTARRLFGKIGNNWIQRVWHKKEYFERYRNWAYSQPLIPEYSKPYIFGGVMIAIGLIIFLVKYTKDKRKLHDSQSTQ